LRKRGVDSAGSGQRSVEYCPWKR